MVLVGIQSDVMERENIVLFLVHERWNIHYDLELIHKR